MTAARQRNGGDSSDSMAAAASALVVAAVVQCNSAVVVAAAAPAPAISCRQGEFNNQQGQEAATMVIWDGRREAVGVRRRNDQAVQIQQRDQGQRRCQ